MPDMSFLSIFLLCNVFLIGALAAIAIQHAYAHFKPPHHESAPQPRPNSRLPQVVKKRLLRKAENNYQTILDRSASELHHSLTATTDQLNKQIEKLGSEIAHDEMKRYRASLDQLREQAEKAIGGAQTEIDKHQAELQAKFTKRQAELDAKLDERHAALEADMKESVAAEKQRLLQQMDTKLADAVASFLTETLQHNVDLGAQSDYLMALLEEHKQELVKGVSNEA